MRRGLIDEFELFVIPIVIGGSTPSFPPGVQIDLELAETRSSARRGSCATAGDARAGAVNEPVAARGLPPACSTVRRPCRRTGAALLGFIRNREHHSEY